MTIAEVAPASWILIQPKVTPYALLVYSRRQKSPQTGSGVIGMTAGSKNLVVFLREQSSCRLTNARRRARD